MSPRTRNAPLAAQQRRSLLALGALSATILFGAHAHAGDVQKALVGRGVIGGALCVLTGGDGGIETTAAGDDVRGSSTIIAGDDGICQSAAVLTDSQNIPVGQGQPFQGVVRTGVDGICDDAIVPGGDDGLVIPQGRGRALMVAIRPGLDNILQSAATPDDISTAVICPGLDSSLESSTDPADQNIGLTDPIYGDICRSLCATFCIVPGTDGILQSTNAVTDVRVPFISTGVDGISQSTKLVGSDDIQTTAAGNGFVLDPTGPLRGEICIDSGPDGVVNTTICGNGVHDDVENPLTTSETECDDTNTVGGDGCGATCQVETGWSCTGTPSVCTPICGDGLTVDGEPCDDDNGSNNDACLNLSGICTAATCGDGFRKTGGPGPNELCDDGNMVNGDGCNNDCTVSGCGDGVVTPPETCDDNNTNNGDGCDANCTPTGCGNGVTTAGETCDDGNGSNLDACLNTCAANVCGDGFTLTGTEQCDDGNPTNGDGCDANCTTTGCGNGIVTGGEACDDGNANNGDGCIATCMVAACGDGFRKTSGGGPNEQCDDGNPTNGDGCDTNCTNSRCGNGVVGAPETCDDSNSVNGDGCDNNCTATACGNGIKTSGETCDDGNASSTDACTNACANAACGDGFIKTSGAGPNEVCDDSNTTSGDGCDANCTPTGCPNGVVTSGETCDDGNPTSGDGCDVNCTPTGCNNGVVSPDEDCEDGNLIDGDGCDSNCTTTGCGNGIATLGEECDDGNSRNDDACVVGCLDARCGDSFKQRTVEECDDGCLAGVPNVCEVVDDDDNGCSRTCTRTRPARCGNGDVEAPETCDDGNNSDADDCTNSCETAVCGDGIVHDRQSGSEDCDDGNAAAGDGCSVVCTSECGNAVFDFYCAEPETSAGQPCTLAADCDSSLGAGDGSCITGEVCDPGSAGLCVDDTINPVCSDFCVVKTCGNDLVECDEECDLGAQNSVPGSGCTTSCTRNLAEKPGTKECPAAFTVDLPPQPLPSLKETCTDGAACDFDQSVNGQCAFRIGVCLNLTQPGCTPGGLRTFDLLGVKIRGTCTAGRTGARCVVGEDCDSSPGMGDGDCLRSRAVVATTTITDAVSLLAPGTGTVPGRCRAGLKGKVCSVNNECDRAFGLGDGRCDIGTGVEFSPPLDLEDQLGTCTPGQDIVVDAGTKLTLKSFVRRESGRADRDRLLLVCEP